MVQQSIRRLSTVIVIATFIVFSAAQTLDETIALYKHLHKGYMPQIRPALNYEDPVKIYVDFRLAFLQDFNDLSGLLKLTAALSLEWIDSRLIWNAADFGNSTEILMPYEDVWSPDFISISAPDHDYLPGQNAKKVRVSSDGWVSMQSFDFLEVVCSVDISDYPYDTQACSITIIPWGYGPEEVAFYKNEDESFRSHIKPSALESSAWQLSKPQISITNKENFSGIRVTLTFTRRYAYVVANLVIPVFILSFLNTWVFWLPPESGERISYSITVFLSFAVYMTILSDHMPKGTEPLATLNYQMIITMLYSVSILFCTILSLRMYNNTDKKCVPIYLIKIVRALTSTNTCLGGTKVEANETDRRESRASIDRRASRAPSMFRDQGDAINAQHPHVNNQRRASLVKQRSTLKLPAVVEDKMDETGEITWLDVGHVFDMSMFVVHSVWWLVLVLIQCLVSVVYIF